MTRGGRSSHRRTALAVLVLAGIALAPALAGSLAPPLVGRGVGSGTSRAPVTTGGVEAPAVMPLGIAHTSKTLVLFNNTVHAGNDLNVSEGTAPEGLAYDSKDGTLWVTAQGSNALAQVNLTTNAGVRMLPSNYEPWGVAYDNLSDELFVAQTSIDSATAYDASTGAIVGTVHLGVEPESVAFDWRTDQVYFANYGSANVSVVDASTLVVAANVTVPSEPRALVYDPAAGAVVVASYTGAALSFVDETTHAIGLSTTVAFPEALAYDGPDQRLYVSNGSGVYPVNATTASFGTVIPSSVTALSLAYDAGAASLYALDEGVGGGGQVQVVPTLSDEVSSTVPLPVYSYPAAIVDDAGQGLVSVADANALYWVGYNVTEISTSSNTVVGSTGLQHLPLSEVYVAPHHAVFVYDGGTGELYEVDDASTTVEGSVFVGFSPEGIGCPGAFLCQGIAYDPVHDTVFVDYYSFVRYGIAAVNASTLAVTDVASGSDAEVAWAGIAVAPEDNLAFVANFTGGNVTVVSTEDDAIVGSITVGSHPLGMVYDPARDYVFVGNSEGSTVSVIDASEEDVIHTVTVGGMPAGEAYDPADGEVYVANSGATNNLTAINATGFWVAANISLDATGTPQGVAYDPTDDVLEVTLSGTTTFPGEVSFVSGSSPTYIGMVEDGSTNAGGAIVYDTGVGASFVADYMPGTISVIVWGSKATPTYSVAFDESGLAPSTPWSVTLQGTLGSSTGTSVGFTEPNGSYAFTIGVVDGYSPNVTGGTVHVRGLPVTWTVVFTPTAPPEWTVSFTESGLPADTSWTVTLGGTPMTETTSTIAFSEPAGTYGFTIGSVTGYTANVTSGAVTVVDAAVGWDVSFAANGPAEQTVSFVEQGLPPGSSWSVTFAGLLQTGATSTIAFEKAAGTWAFNVSGPSGYSASPASGVVVVHGVAVQRMINFTATPSSSPSTFLGLPGDSGYALLAGGFAVLAAVALLLARRRRRRPTPPPAPSVTGPAPPPPEAGG
ncbi:MAG TPA: hypothetical protein VMH49_00295 [Thermoplasmata archaeon]|nr:hypothetical protein [Thermoplasmata archaeon]